MYSGEEGGGIFGIACCDASPSFKMEESIFDQMPRFIKLFIVRSLDVTVFPWRDHSNHPFVCDIFNDLITIIAPICQKVLGTDAFNQATCLFTICCCTFCNKGPDRHTMRIHGQMKLGVKPPFVRFIS